MLAPFLRQGCRRLQRGRRRRAQPARVEGVRRTDPRRSPGDRRRPAHDGGPGDGEDDRARRGQDCARRGHQQRGGRGLPQRATPQTHTRETRQQHSAAATHQQRHAHNKQQHTPVAPACRDRPARHSALTVPPTQANAGTNKFEGFMNSSECPRAMRGPSTRINAPPGGHSSICFG